MNIITFYESDESRKKAYLELDALETSIRGALYGSDCNVEELATKWLKEQGWEFENVEILAIAEMLFIGFIRNEKLLIGHDSQLAKIKEQIT